MVSILWSVCCYMYVVGRVMLCVYWLSEEPVVYVSFSWNVGECVYGSEMCEARVVTEVGKWWVV